MRSLNIAQHLVKFSFVIAFLYQFTIVFFPQKNLDLFCEMIVEPYFDFDFSVLLFRFITVLCVIGIVAIIAQFAVLLVAILSDYVYIKRFCKSVRLWSPQESTGEE